MEHRLRSNAGILRNPIVRLPAFADRLLQHVCQHLRLSFSLCHDESSASGIQYKTFGLYANSPLSGIPRFADTPQVRQVATQLYSREARAVAVVSQQVAVGAGDVVRLSLKLGEEGIDAYHRIRGGNAAEGDGESEGEGDGEGDGEKVTQGNSRDVSFQSDADAADKDGPPSQDRS